jgi:hypothetical protein
LKNKISLLAGSLLISLNLFAASEYDVKHWWERIVPSKRTVAVVTVAALGIASVKAAEALNSSEPFCDAYPLASSEPSLQMATTYFTEGGECAVRCIAEADWLGPLYAVCADSVGCAGMILEGALGCVVNSEHVAQFACSITQRNLSLP